jgi:hypothetical protein
MDEAKSNPFPFDYKTESSYLNHLRKQPDLALDDRIRNAFNSSYPSFRDLSPPLTLDLYLGLLHKALTSSVVLNSISI